jgi:class 3 adenylate cyclase
MKTLAWMRTLSRNSGSQMSIKSKLILMLLFVSGFSILISSALGYRSGQKNLTNRVFSQLTSVRASKAYQIESYFQTIQNHTETLGEDLSIIAAIEQFSSAYEQLQSVTNPKISDQAIATYYSTNFLPRLDEFNSGTPNLFDYLPRGQASSYLQYNYIAANPNPVGKKQQLIAASDGSAYSKIHARYHPIFRNIVNKFGYYDMFLVNAKGEIVYTVFKETDYATSLVDGPYKNSNLAILVRQMIASKEKNFTKLIDFASYEPSYGAPASFIATPVYNGSSLVGVLAFQMPVDEINNVMTGSEEWQQDGLGKTGETILVGKDSLMRSASRFYLEDPKAYLSQLQSRGAKNDVVNRLRQYGTTILQQQVQNAALSKANAGGSGTMQVLDYRGVPVLSSFSPLKIPGLDWVIIAQMDLAEAYEPIYAFQRQILTSVTLLILLITMLAMALAHQFVKPIQHLIESARKVSSGELTSIPEFDGNDEFSELTHSFNNTLQSLQSQTLLVDQKNQENEKLLFSVFPPAIARRLQRGESHIADDILNVAVLYADLKGFSRINTTISAHERLSILNDLIGSFDELSDSFGVEKVKTIGDSYLAVCGLSVPYLDPDKRSLDFAIEMLAIMRRFNLERGFDLRIQIGIHSGDILAGIVGKTRIVYDIWGETVKQAYNLSQLCKSNNICVSEVIHQRLEDLYGFELGNGPTDVESVPQLWRLTGSISNSSSLTRNL